MTDVSLSTDQNVLNKMGIGARVIIEINTPNGQSVQAISTLIGFKKGQYIFVDYPVSPPLEFNKIYLEGAEVTFRSITNTIHRDVIAFRTQVHSVIYRPMEMICLHAPKSISMRQIRTHQRLDTKFSCNLTVGGHSIAGVMTDFSVGGCAISLPTKLDQDTLINQKVSISIELETVAPITVTGEIKNVDAKEKQSKLGVMFNSESISESDLQTLHHQCILKN